MPSATQKANESPIIARFSSRETRITFSTWKPEALPTRQIIGAKEPTRTVSASSSEAARSRRLVIPKALIVAFAGWAPARRSKNSASFGFELGKPASMKWTPSASSASTTFSFSPTERDIPCPPMPSRKVVS